MNCYSSGVAFNFAELLNIPPIKNIEQKRLLEDIEALTERDRSDAEYFRTMLYRAVFYCDISILEIAKAFVHTPRRIKAWINGESAPSKLLLPQLFEKLNTLIKQKIMR